MIDPYVGLGVFRIAIFIILVSGGLLFFLEPGTATFIVDVLALFSGLVLAGLVVALVRKK